ncbi:hypothetical protein [Nocardia ninae]|uniref:Antitoxin VbhA domain-containing protein n=1 Tax=Nocardia ninae NBRC 108245 TaxID=1210091 RepID=A0A511MLG4_9NOCA|nr:hypothetical protein [Nocardia ninae]GEM41291.1 hypothetical protein NN4_58100 [Nocardia ninae NBRC 108245]
MSEEAEHRIGEGPAMRMIPTLPEGAAQANRRRAVERELRGMLLDEYLADHERRNGSLGEAERQRARDLFDSALGQSI